MKILLSFVGNTDPWFFKGAPEEMTPECPLGRDNEGAALSLCDHLKPERIYLFPSSKANNPASSDNTEWRAEKIQTLLSKRYPEMQCKILPLNVKDATDFEQLSKEFDYNIELVIKELGNDIDTSEFFINCTSGTQQMTALGYVFANTGRLSSCSLIQCKDPGKLKKGEARFREVEATFLTVNEYIKKIHSDIDNMLFASASSNAKSLAKITAVKRQKDAAKFLSKIFSVYNYIDLLNYKVAFGTMHELTALPEYSKILSNLTPEHKKLFDAQYEMLKNLKNSPSREVVFYDKILKKETPKPIRAESPENLTDLFFNMKRCLERGAYADALARFRRICEGSVYYRLEHSHGINPSDLSNSSKKDSLEKLKKCEEDERFKIRFRPQFMGLDNGRYALLKVFDVGVFGTDFDEFFDVQIREMTADGRDNTIVAHGMEAVDKEKAEKCLSAAERVICTLIPETVDIIESYPFKKEQMMAWLPIVL